MLSLSSNQLLSSHLIVFHVVDCIFCIVGFNANRTTCFNVYRCNEYPNIQLITSPNNKANQSKGVHKYANYTSTIEERAMQAGHYCCIHTEPHSLYIPLTNIINLLHLPIIVSVVMGVTLMSCWCLFVIVPALCFRDCSKMFSKSELPTFNLSSPALSGLWGLSRPTTHLVFSACNAITFSSLCRIFYDTGDYKTYIQVRWLIFLIASYRSILV